jgi:hypothetical protein
MIRNLIFFTLLIKSFLCFSQNSKYGELLGSTADSCKVYFNGKKNIIVDEIGNEIKNIRVDEYNFKYNIVKLPNGMFIDYDSELQHYAIFSDKNEQLTQYLYKQIFYNKNTIVTFRREFIPNENSYFKKNRNYLEFLDFKLKSKIPIKLFDISGASGNRFINSEGLIGYQTLKPTKSLMMDKGFLDFTGNVIIQPNYLQIKSFKEGLAAVLGWDTNRRLRWGFIDKKGKVVIPIKFKDEPTDFKNGISLINDPEDEGIFPEKVKLNKNGEVLK